MPAVVISDIGLVFHDLEGMLKEEDGVGRDFYSV